MKKQQDFTAEGKDCFFLKKKKKKKELKSFKQKTSEPKN